MCLNVKDNTKIRTVKKERTVYKIMCERHSKRIVSPFRMNPIEIGKIDEIKNDLYIDVFHEVDEGFHSFKKLKDAKSEVINRYWFYVNFDFYQYVIVKCKIPVGAQIVKGTFFDNESYVSNKIKYEKIVYNYCY